MNKTSRRCIFTLFCDHVMRYTDETCAVLMLMELKFLLEKNMFNVSSPLSYDIFFDYFQQNIVAYCEGLYDGIWYDFRNKKIIKGHPCCVIVPPPIDNKIIEENGDSTTKKIRISYETF
jgi:hypothetical protein